MIIKKAEQLNNADYNITMADLSLNISTSLFANNVANKSSILNMYLG